MQKDKITRSYLETLSFSELLKLAEKLDLDIPENLNYHILVGEILELCQENGEILVEEMDISETDEKISVELPKSYNITEVKLMMLNPSWGYVYWNISESDFEEISKNPTSQLILRIGAYSEKDNLKPDETYNIQISLTDNEQYFLFPTDKKFIKVDLLFAIGVSIDILTSSNMLELPDCPPILKEFCPGKKLNISKPVELSGMIELLNEQYTNHRDVLF